MLILAVAQEVYKTHMESKEAIKFIMKEVQNGGTK